MFFVFYFFWQGDPGCSCADSVFVLLPGFYSDFLVLFVVFVSVSVVSQLFYDLSVFHLALRLFLLFPHPLRVIYPVTRGESRVKMKKR